MIDLWLPGEKLLWSGHPAQGIRARPADALLIPSGSGWPGMSRYTAPAFELIEDARRVYDLLQSAQRDAARAGA
jgi:hypothetical protein